MVFTSGADKAKRLMHGLVKDNAVLGDLCHSSQEMCASNQSIFKSVFVLILTYDHESWVATESVLPQVRAAEMAVLWRVHGVTLRDKFRSWEFPIALNVEIFPLWIEQGRRGGAQCLEGRITGGCRKVPTMSQVLSSRQYNTRGAKLVSCTGRHLTSVRPWNRVFSYVGSAAWPELPRKDLWGTFCWLHPQKSGLKAWALEGFFPRKRQKYIFPGGGPKSFSRGPKVVKFHFTVWEKKFSTKTLKAKCEILKSRDVHISPLTPIPNALA